MELNLKIERENNKLIFLFFIPLLIYFGKRSLIAFDEGFYAIQARWIVEKSNWIGPMWWDQVSTDRTIGIQFLIAISKKIFGESLFVIYIPTILASVLMLYCTYQLHKELLEDKYPIYSTLILSTTFLWINYAHMATQDMVYASLISLGIISSIKAYKRNTKSNLLISGAWIGLAFMFKTYLTAIPLLAIFPFLLKSKIIYKRLFLIGTFLGFLPYIFWSYQFISIYSFEAYTGLFEKLVRLSKNNTFTNPIYYYFWNFTINIFPWTIPSIFGFLKSSKLKSMQKYFLFFYPLFVLSLLSLFSTKTPYYPLQILSLVSLNSYIGIKSLIENYNNKIIFYIEKVNYFFIPLLLICSPIFIVNFLKEIYLDNRIKTFLYFAFTIFSIIWLSYNFIKNKKQKLFFSICGSYFLILLIVQSGLITDKSKELRIVIDDLIKNEELRKLPIQIIKSDISDDESFSKIIKIMVMSPKFGNGLENLDELKRDNYAWTTSNLKNDEKNNYKIINEDKVFYPWKLVYKK